MKQQENREVLNGVLLQKYRLKLTLQQIYEAQDGEVVNGCMILKEDEYKSKKYCNRIDFDAVLALTLRKVPVSMFYKARNLKAVVMLEAEEIADGKDNKESNDSSQEDEKVSQNLDKDFGAFEQTVVEYCYFPKLKRAGAFAFRNCPITALDGSSFPCLEEIGDSGFAECHMTKIDLPALLSVGRGGFRDCKGLRHFSAKKLGEVGAGCFSMCPLLSSIDCDVKPEIFTCQYYGCGACPACYCDVEVCLQRGRSGQQDKHVQIDEYTINQVLSKYQVGITVHQALNADEGQVINECLILKEEHYQKGAFQERKDFKSVLALRLRHVSEDMFIKAQNLITAIMLEAVGAMSGSFRRTGLQNCFCPKLVRTSNFTFAQCQVKDISSSNFPAIETIGESGFFYCPVTQVNLPNLLSISEAGFSWCKSLKRFEAQKLSKIGVGCFSNCPKLESINCDLKPNKFICSSFFVKECGECPACKKQLPECLARGAVPKKAQTSAKLCGSALYPLDPAA